MINIGFGLHPEMATTMMMVMVVKAVTLNTFVALLTKVLMTETVNALTSLLVLLNTCLYLQQIF